MKNNTALSERRTYLLPEDVTTCKPIGTAGSPAVCPFCQQPIEGAYCQSCDLQFVHVTDDEVETMGFAVSNEPPSALPVVSPNIAYRSDWERDRDNCALFWLKCVALNLWICVACLINYPDPKRPRFRYPWWPRPLRLPGLVAQLLLGLSDDQFKERAAHLPGRTTDHERWYDTATLMEAYWAFLRDEQPARRQTRHDRWTIINNCHLPTCPPFCQRQHRARRRLVLKRRD